MSSPRLLILLQWIRYLSLDGIPSLDALKQHAQPDEHKRVVEFIPNAWLDEHSYDCQRKLDLAWFDNVLTNPSPTAAPCECSHEA